VTLIPSQVMFLSGNDFYYNFNIFTAAHCIEDATPSKLKILLGRHKLNDTSGSDWIEKSVAEINIHPEYWGKSKAGDADISLIKLSSSVQFSVAIQPICLPDANANVENLKGIVVGYGKSEGAGLFENTPRFIDSIATVGLLTCVLSDARYFNIVSERTFCAGGLGRAPCRGDSGGTFFIFDPALDSYVAYGIVSQSLIDQNDDCDVNKYAVYVSIPKYIPWIDTISKKLIMFTIFYII
jgi:HGF/MSP/plasminogen-like protein